MPAVDIHLQVSHHIFQSINKFVKSKALVIFHYITRKLPIQIYQDFPRGMLHHGLSADCLSTPSEALGR